MSWENINMFKCVPKWTKLRSLSKYVQMAFSIICELQMSWNVWYHKKVLLLIKSYLDELKLLKFPFKSHMCRTLWLGWVFAYLQKV